MSTSAPGSMSAIDPYERSVKEDKNEGTGVARRTGDLGRIVVLKEIGRTLKIYEDEI